MTASDWAAWVQAFGAVAALGVAVGLNRRDAHERQIERRARARNAAITLHPLFMDAHKTLTWASVRLSQGARPDAIGSDEEGREFGILGMGLLNTQFTASIPLIASIGSAERDVHLAVTAIERLVAVTRAAAIDDGGPDDWYYAKEAWPDIRENVERSKVAAGMAVGALEGVLWGA